MSEYLTRRFISSVVTIIVISMMCFLIINLPSGDVASEYEYRLQANHGYSRQSALVAGEVLRHQYGLDQPLPLRYAAWLREFVQGDFGVSLVTFRPVADLIWERMLYTLLFAFLGLGVSWAVGIAIGIYSATHQYSFSDYLATLIGFLGLSIPDFLLALVLLTVSVLVLGTGLPTGLFSQSYADAEWSWGKVRDLLGHLWIPMIVIGLPGAASVLRIIRGNLLDVLGHQYIETARARGLSERRVILKHAARVAINPLISLMGVQFPLIISAGIVVSIVLGLPTVGPLLYDALLSQDIYVSATVLMLLGILLVIGNFVADLVLAWVDPRIRLG